MLFTISSFLFNNSMSVNFYDKINPLNSFLITTTLVLFIIISLYLTFYQKGNAVHKVLGLLLSSIFIVFLWIMQTQFLFIYLVYILAFISAVLMLFLSVVLMLPISTLNNNINKNYIYPLFSVEFLEYFTLETIFLLIIFYNLLYVVNKNFLYSFIKKLIHTDNFNNGYVIINNYILNKYKLSTTSFIFHFNYLTYKFINVVTTISKLSFNSLVRYFYYFLFVFSNNYNINKQKFIDVIVQLYLFINMFLIIILSQISVNSIQTSVIVEEKVLGLGVLKDLLYNQYPAFLIISTTVLLVALIGAAIMTKKIK